MLGDTSWFASAPSGQKPVQFGQHTTDYGPETARPVRNSSIAAHSTSMASNLTNLGSNRLHTDRELSARQIRAARALLGWSRRQLAIASGVSEGTIKAIEHGAVDTRLVTMDKLGRVFAAQSIAFVADDPWTGVVINLPADDGKYSAPQLTRSQRDEVVEDAEGPIRRRFGWFRLLGAGRR
jgi:DNA-binding XRE family transcriptional regulator